MKTREELVKDLKAAMIRMAFSCYSEDKTTQEIVKGIIETIGDTVEYLESEEADDN